MEIPEENYLEHYGILRRSGRYPWGSSGNVAGRSQTFVDMRKQLRDSGMSEKEIADAWGMSTKELRDTTTIARSELKAANVAMALALRDKGNSPKAIAQRMGIPEPTVRNYLKPGAAEKSSQLRGITDTLRDEVKNKTYVDVGVGAAERHGMSAERLSSAIAVLKDEGYSVHTVKVDTGAGRQTTYRVLAPPGTTQRDIFMNRSKIEIMGKWSEDGGKSFIEPLPPKSIDSKRVQVKYADDGGDKADGVVYVRPGVDDISIGANRYAQVRIMVDGTHYIKGMAVYKSDLPPGVDLQFNTNKDRTGDKLDALKPLSDSPISPFKTVVRQITDLNANGEREVTSVMNIVGTSEESGVEGSWDNWSRNLPSQFLAKQTPAFAREQLQKTYESKVRDFEEINSLTNPSVKKKLLESLADESLSSAVNMKAQALKGQSTHVILPINSLKDTEVFAPNYNDGDQVALVRFPHAGRFEIPVLTVNNRNPEAVKLLGKQPKDAVGINSAVAERLSGADFDGDTVLVLPNNNRKIKSDPPLEGLAKFDSKRAYPGYEGMKVMTNTQTEMGKISNLITDMSVRGATPDELARAARHSMVVIDAEKHKLDYKTSEERNGIKALQDKYQKPYTETGRAGASTLLSRSTSERPVLDRKLRTYATDPDGPIDRKTGKLVYEPTGKLKKDGTPKTTKVERGLLTDDAFTLTSGGSKKNPGTNIEEIYAEHSNRLRDLSNTARLEAVKTKPTPYNPAARKAYQNEVDSLVAKLRVATSNAPLERQAQVIQNQIYRNLVHENPNMDKDDKRKLRYVAVKQARAMTGADKADIKITNGEWAAIQAGAISPNRLDKILRATDLERVKELALPKPKLLMSTPKVSRAKAMLARGATQAEVARALGVSLTTLKDSLS